MIRVFSLALLLVLSPAGLAASLKVGDAAPALSLPNLPAGNQQTSLESLRGKVVYVDFWASWCGPCRISLPQLNALRAELGPQGFEVLAVNVDEVEEDALAFLRELPVDYPVVWDNSGASPRAWGVPGMPSGFLVDTEGVIRDIHKGYRRGDGEKLRVKILQLLELVP